MPENVLTIGIAVIVLAVVALIVLLVFAYSGSGKTMETPMAEEFAPDARQDSIDDRPSSVISEQIEAMARKRLQNVPSLSDTHIDFGAVHDGTIDVWIDGVQYDDPEDIPDEGIRQAITEAVAEFNAS